MSADLAFLSPAAARGAPLRTPMEAGHIAAGAGIEERDGWRIAIYPDRDAPVRAADVSQLSKTELRGDPEEIDAATSAAPHALRLTPRRALLLGAPALPPAPCPLPPLDATCIYSAVRIGGERVRPLFARLSALDARPRSLPDGAVMLGSVARCPAIVVNEGGDRLLVMAGWEYGAYLWETVLDAGAPLGIAPRTEAP